METKENEEVEIMRQYDEAMRGVYEYEKDIQTHNENLIKSICSSALKSFSELVDGCSITDKIEVVEAPEGDLQKDEKFGVFKKIYVDQKSVGYSGDSFSGFIYAKYGKSGKWLKIPYDC